MKHRIVLQKSGQSAGQWLHLPEFSLEPQPVCAGRLRRSRGRQRAEREAHDRRILLAQGALRLVKS